MSCESKNIAFFISDHGFAHASRNIPIIRYILEANNDIRVIIKTGKSQGEFIKELVRDFGDRVSYFFGTMDIGLVLMENSLDIDKEKLKAKVEEYINSLRKRLLKKLSF